MDREVVLMILVIGAVMFFWIGFNIIMHGVIQLLKDCPC